MAKDKNVTDSEVQLKKKTFIGCTYSFWSKLVNAVIGFCMILYAIRSFFYIPDNSSN